MRYTDSNWMDNIESYIDEYINTFTSYSFTGEEDISEELGWFVKRLEMVLDLKDHQINWKEIDEREDFQEMMELCYRACIGPGPECVFAIFCLDRGLVNCQMNVLADLGFTYENYLLPEVITARRLAE